MPMSTATATSTNISKWQYQGHSVRVRARYLATCTERRVIEDRNQGPCLRTLGIKQLHHIRQRPKLRVTPRFHQSRDHKRRLGGRRCKHG